MALYLGGDLGTSALKLIVTDERGKVLASVSEAYPLSFPKTGWSEERPEDWWKALEKGLSELGKKVPLAEIRGMAFDGQMHGLVALGRNGKVLRPAILWNDSRSVREVRYLNEKIGKKTLLRETGNIAYPGFTAPKILWMKKNEPTLFKKIAHLLLPKDYLVYRLTGIYATEVSDASGTLLFDVRHRRWSKKMMALCSVKEEFLPPVLESGERVGTVRKDIASSLALNPQAFVLAGAADNAAAALGLGVIREGQCNLSVGTSGTVFIASKTFHQDPHGAIHAFCSADGGYCLLACSLSSASCLKWLNEDILKTTDFAGEQAKIKSSDLGKNEVYFLPYLMGERSPINDPYARGVFAGLSLSTKREDLTQAVLEGVAFALRDSLRVCASLGIQVLESSLTGGGSQSPLWRKIFADVFGIPLSTASDAAGPAFGMILLSLVSDHVYPDLPTAVKSLLPTGRKILPDPKKVRLYEDRYRRFRKLYPALKPVFPSLAED
jgi:xylulokinase